MITLQRHNSSRNWKIARQSDPTADTAIVTHSTASPRLFASRVEQAGSLWCPMFRKNPVFPFTILPSLVGSHEGESEIDALLKLGKWHAVLVFSLLFTLFPFFFFLTYELTYVTFNSLCCERVTTIGLTKGENRYNSP